MLIFTTRFTRKKAVLAVLALGVVMAVLVLLAGSEEAVESAAPVLTDNAQRVEYLQSLGWDVTEEPVETLQFLLPDTLEEPYLSYNQMQLTQGLDLSLCCGKQVERYTYAVNNYPGIPEGVQLNLYICEGTLAAGDVCHLGANGFQRTLEFPASE